MKIGVLGSGYDRLPVRHLLNRYDHEYIFLVDQLSWPRTEKSIESVEQRIEMLIAEGKKHGVEQFIMPPPFEYAFLKKRDDILPIYNDFLLLSLEQSRIGKVGIMSTYDDSQLVQSSLEESMNAYEHTAQQSETKRFHKPFALRIKQIRAIPLFVPLMSKSDWMVRKTLKQQMRYFKDADVDLLIPHAWEVLNYEKTITHILSEHRTRFAGSEILTQVFDKHLGTSPSSSYAVTIVADNTPGFLSEKKWELPISKGGAVAVQFIQCSFS